MPGSGHCFLTGAQKLAEAVRPSFLPQEEKHRSLPQKSEGFGDSKWGGMPEIERLGHRPGEHGEQPETREAGVIDCFSLRAH